MKINKIKFKNNQVNKNNKNDQINFLLKKINELDSRLK